jgi:hypothetical protein
VFFHREVHVVLARQLLILISAFFIVFSNEKARCGVLELSRANDPSIVLATIKISGVPISESATYFISADGQFTMPYHLLKGLLQNNIKKLWIESQDERKMSLIKYSHCNQDLDLCLLKANYKPQKWVEPEGPVAELVEKKQAWIDLAAASRKIFDTQTAESKIKAKDFEKYLNYPKKHKPLDSENFAYIQLPFAGRKLSIPLYREFPVELCRQSNSTDVSITCPNKDNTAYITFDLKKPEQESITKLKGKPYYKPVTLQDAQDLMDRSQWARASKYMTQEQQSQFFSSSTNMKCKKSPKKTVNVLLANNNQCWGFTYNDKYLQASSFYKLIQAPDSSVLQTKIWVEHAGQVLFDYRLVDIALANAVYIEEPTLATKEEGPNQYARACQLALNNIYSLERDFQHSYQSYTSDLSAIGFDNKAINPYPGMILGFNQPSHSEPVGLVPNYNPQRKRAISGRMPASVSLELNSTFAGLKGATAEASTFKAYCLFPRPEHEPEIWSIDQNGKLQSY